MLTSYFARHRDLVRTPGLSPVSIALKTPDWIGVELPRYHALCPTIDLVVGAKNGTVDYYEYRNRYHLMLRQLDVVQVWQQIHIFRGGGRSLNSGSGTCRIMQKLAPKGLEAKGHQ